MRLLRPSWLWALLLALSACSSTSTTPSDAGTQPDSGTQRGRIEGQAILEGASSHGGISVSVEGASLSATTATDGRFALENVAPGTHIVVARRSGYTEARQSVTVIAEATASVRLDLGRGRGSILGTVQVEGVLDSSGVTVTLVETGATTTSDATGIFTFSDLAQGTYTLALQKAGYLETRQTVEVRGTGSTLVNLSLSRERGSVSGVIQFEGASNHAGAVVTLVEAALTATTNAEGQFDIQNVMTGTYTLRVRRESYVDAQQLVEVRANQPSQVNLTLSLVRGDVAGTVQLSDGATPSGVTITVTQTGANTTTNAQGQFTLTGLPLGTYTLTAQRQGYAVAQQTVTVRTGAAATVAFTLVRAQGRVEGSALLEGASSHGGISVTLAGTGATTTTDSQGRFTFSNVASGTYTVEARRSGYAVASQSVQVQEAQTATVSLSLTRERGNVAGVILLEGGSSPVDINVTLAGTAFSARTNTAGQFSLTGIPTGSYTLEAQKDGFATAQRAVEVRAGEQAQVSLTLAIARGSISGVVLLEDANTTSGISVALLPGNVTVLTDAQGRFSFSGLVVGPYTLSAFWPGYEIQERSVVVRYQEDTVVNITLQRRPGVVAGIIQLEGESHHEGVTVSLSGHGATATTDAQGHFVLEGVPQGPHTLAASKANYAQAVAELDVSEGQLHPVSLSLARLGALEVSAPRLAVQGGHLTLTGSGFGAARGPFTVTVGGEAVTDFISWSDTQVVARVAHHVVPGQHDVVVTPGVPWRRDATTSVRVLPQQTVAYGAQWGVGVLPSNHVSVWGEPSLAGLHPIPAGLTDVVSVATARMAAFALQADGTVVAWGGGLPSDLSVPADLTQVVAIAGGDSFVLALKADGTLVAWGDSALAPPSGVRDVVGIAATRNAGQSFLADGTVVSWGHGNEGRTGPPEQLHLPPHDEVLRVPAR
ncbi:MULTISPECIES: carboxypeptidase regulatory-like domain-containing protein [unclassified Myxococcus]|uniref:carboxypeptidase regulatory-like domain-containing protein n=1 Tax=unclassified Myxococcus TaxID=2648731 RepID=UPI0020CF5EF0|nr:MULTISPECIES: carboxypeptidase regulatory-like domain-containing protein [unclassified Myxococcus]